MKRLLAFCIALFASMSMFAQAPKTFANPLDVIIGNERAYRGGEPIVLIYQDDYYLFVSHRKGYWYSPDFRNWTYVDAPNYPGGVVSVAEYKGTLIGCSMNNKNVYKCIDAKKGQWELCGQLDRDRYGDANFFVDDDDRLYLYFGWSQIMPFQVVELDPVTFHEITEPKQLFFSDIMNHGFEARKPEDVIYSIFNGRRDYFEEEFPWIEGPWMTKHNGKYYLQYAAIGLEFISYSHGVYVSDSPTGPFTYSEHNPLTFKTSGFQVGAGHGSTFHDKNGRLWTICMIPAQFGGTGRGSELAIYPTAVDAEGVMYSNTALGDYPQFYPDMRPSDGVDNYADWMLLSNGKKAIVSSTYGNFTPDRALDENFTTYWCAETGNPGEFFTVDLGADANICAIQINWDHIDAQASQSVGDRMSGFTNNPDHYQCYTVEVSRDGNTWTKVIDKPNNKIELRHDYNELATPQHARYVRVTNVACYDNAKFSIKDLRVFGTTSWQSRTKVEDVKVVRNPEDRREANLLWDPVPGADGYVVRYGIEPNKLYNSYIVYGKNTLYMHSLNTAPEYYFDVEAFDSGLNYYKENTLATKGTGAEIQLLKRKPGERVSGYTMDNQTRYFMIKEGVNEYVFDDVTPGYWVLSHSYGPVFFNGELTEKDLISKDADPKPTYTEVATKMGVGTQITKQLRFEIIPGKTAGKIRVVIEDVPAEKPSSPSNSKGSRRVSNRK
ncbi:MAG: family 43 glycosylhydrolase [Bacteroidales bacterium]|nr:family 43 glycosylhydrolase [Bacteroidales bacterium]